MVDASVAIKWVAPEPYTDQAISLLETIQLCAPAHWITEAVNGIWGKYRRGQWNAELTRARAGAMMRSPVESVPVAVLMDRAIEHAIAMRVTIYDSLYIALAEARRIPLISDDRKLLGMMAADPALAALAQPLSDLALP